MKNQIVSYMEDLKNIIEDFPVSEMEGIIRIFINAYNTGRKIFVMGNGGSASTASHLACDINKGVSGKLNRRFNVICLNDNVPTMLAYANDVSFDDVFTGQLKNFIEPGDLLIAISASGNSKNVIKAVRFANNKGAVTIGLTGCDGGKLAGLSKHAIIIKSNDIQKIEDMHVIITHILMQVLLKELKG